MKKTNIKGMDIMKKTNIEKKRRKPIRIVLASILAILVAFISAFAILSVVSNEKVFLQALLDSIFLINS